MKWLVQTLDGLTAHCDEIEAANEQAKLEALIGRYKNLIPTIEITMVKTEVFSKCYTYRREVKDICNLLHKVKEQSSASPPVDTLETINKLIVQQETAINQLDNQRPKILSMIQRGKDLVKDTHAPTFVPVEVKTLESDWNEAYSQSIEKMKKLKGAQKVWNNYILQKNEILELLNKAENELKSMSSDQKDSKTLAVDLQAKHAMSVILRQATDDMLNKLRVLCGSLCAHTVAEQKPVLEKEVSDIEKRLHGTLSLMQEKVERLEEYSSQWKAFQTRLAELQAWTRQVAPQLVSQLQNPDMSPEERVNKSNALQKMIADKMNVLDQLNAEALTLSEVTPEAHNLKAEVQRLREDVSSLNRTVDNQSKAVTHDLLNWQKYQAQLSEVKPWVEQSEQKITLGMAKPVTLTDAENQLQQAKLFEQQCEAQLEKLHGISAISHQLTCKTSAPDELDAIHSRWSIVHDTAQQWGKKMSKLVNSWRSFDAEADKMETWITNCEKTITQTPLNMKTSSVEKLEKDLIKIKSFNNEVSEQQAKLISLTNNADNVCHGLAVEGANIVKGRVADMKARVNQLAEAARAKINALSDAIIARQDFQTRCIDFNNWMSDLRSSTARIDEINTDRVGPSLQNVLTLLQEHNDKQSAFNAIDNEIKHLMQNAVPEEVNTLREMQNNLDKNYHNLKQELEDKKHCLEKWSQLLNWCNETNQQLVHIKYQAQNQKLPTEELLLCASEVDTILAKINSWKPQVAELDKLGSIQMHDLNSGKLTTGNQLLRDLEMNAANIKIQLQSKKESQEKVTQHWNEFQQTDSNLKDNIKVIRFNLEEIVRYIRNPNDVEDALMKLNELSKTLDEKAILKNKLHNEGSMLIQEAPTKAASVQNVVSDIETAWDSLATDVNATSAVLNDLLNAFKEFESAKIYLNTELDKVDQLYSSVKQEPNDVDQVAMAYDKIKTAADIIKKAKPHLDKMEMKFQTMSQPQSLTNYQTVDSEKELAKCKNRYQDNKDKISARAQIQESQLILWRQIDEAKNDLLSWLGETKEALNNALENTTELEYSQIRLNKYNDELPTYLALRDGITSKTSQLTEFNDGNPISTLIALDRLLGNQFSDIKSIAEQLQDITQSFGEQEKEIRQEIRKAGECISNIRESVIKCDDMTGENEKILERLQTCKSLKDQLYDCGDNLDNLHIRIDEMKSMYPSYSESIIPKELDNTQKRFNVVMNHANKVEETLMSFLTKHHTDNYDTINRVLATLSDKLDWCAPEASSDRYNLEVKLSALTDVKNGIENCSVRKLDLEKSLSLLENVQTPEVLSKFKHDCVAVNNNLKNLSKKQSDVEKALNDNIELWKKYELTSENIGSWLKETEGAIRSENANQFNISLLNDKKKEIKSLQSQTLSQKSDIDDLLDLSNAIMHHNPESRVGQYVSHLTTRYDAIIKLFEYIIERIDNLEKNNEVYKKNKQDYETWFTNINKKLQEVQKSSTAKVTPQLAEEIKELLDDRNVGQELLNKTIDKGESLYPNVTPDNRETIRNDLRQLRDGFEKLCDQISELNKSVESALIQRSTFEENFTQINSWVTDSRQKIAKQDDLCATLPEKKQMLQTLKILAQDIIFHKQVLKQLHDKNVELADPEISEKLNTSMTEYNSSENDIKQRTQKVEQYIADHENYNVMLENLRDWLSNIIAEAKIITEQAPEKESVKSNMLLLKNILERKSDGDALFEKCQKQLNIVIKGTSAPGHHALLKSLEDQKLLWQSMLQSCADTSEKLNCFYNQWAEYENTIEALETFSRQKENLIKDQSLKSSEDTKMQHLGKLRAIDDDFTAKSIEFNQAASMAQDIEGESELAGKVSRILTKYQSLKNSCKEAIAKYELYVSEHSNFNKDYQEFKNILLNNQAELNQLNEIVGSMAILQDRQNKIRQLSEGRLNDITTFDLLMERGEKLYAHTSPDGREIIRQQLRSLRLLWDTFTDDLNNGSQKLDNCLLQLSDYTASQEQLAKWLAEAEKAMQQHTELKASLPEKKAQLQNHTIMHQEILAHQQLVESVCDKAQHLVNQTKDISLNIYINSIKQCFQNILERSESLLTGLGDCVTEHDKLLIEFKKFKDWLAHETEKLNECDNIKGEKSELSKRLGIVKNLDENKANGFELLQKLQKEYLLVNKWTSPKGNEIIEKEIEDLENQFTTHANEIKKIQEKLLDAEKRWHDFDSGLEEFTKWCREIEVVLRDQPLQATLQEKEKQLDYFKNQRDVVLGKEKVIDNFVDKSNSLLNSSGTERIKPLISQISNRYQLLHVMSKEVINRWNNLVDSHKKYVDKLDEAKKWLEPLEKHLVDLNNDLSKADVQNNKLQLLLAEKEQAEPMLAAVTLAGERLYPDTSSQGREIIRSELRNLRDRWDKLNEGIKEHQKLQEAHTVQWSSYNDLMQQVLAWLDSMEKIVQGETGTGSSSSQELKAKLSKYKANLQEILTHKRLIETVTDKAGNVVSSLQANDPAKSEINNAVKNINSRYENLNKTCQDTITQLENLLDMYQNFTDQQKAFQDYQKYLWDQLSSYSDYSGNKAALQVRLRKITDLQDGLSEGHEKLSLLNNHIEKCASSLPNRVKEGMERDLSNLNFDFDKFINSLNDIKHELETRLQQWVAYEASFEKLIQWLTDSENSLKNYTPKSSLEEKQEQLEKYKVIEFFIIIFYGLCRICKPLSFCQ